MARIKTTYSDAKKTRSNDKTNIYVKSADALYNIINENKVETVDPLVVDYLNTNKESVGTYVNSITVNFGAWLSAPPSLPATNANNFIFLCNGQFIERAAIFSFAQVGGGSELVIDPNILGYSFESDDVIIGVGKFA